MPRPDLFPHHPVPIEPAGIFGRGRVRHLRPLVISDARLGMVHPVEERREIIRRIIEAAFGHHQPMAEIGGKAQIGRLRDDLQRQPRAVERGRAVRFQADRDPGARAEFVRARQEIDLLRQRPAVGAGQRVDKPRAHHLRPLDRAFEKGQVIIGRPALIRDHVAAGKHHRDIIEPLPRQRIAQGPGALDRGRQPRLHPDKARLARLAPAGCPIGLRADRPAPQGSKQVTPHRAHRTSPARRWQAQSAQ